jgi:hypothetical protein
MPSDTKITNTISIFAPKGKKIDFTEAAIMVRGTLKLEPYTDSYGYSYNYRIVDVTIEKPNEDESVEIDKNVKTNDEITHPSVVWTPYTIEDKTTLITNEDGNLNKKYIETRVPSDFYGEIKTESESKAQKPKKRRL